MLRDRSLARAVAGDPTHWLDRLRDSGQVKDGTVQAGVLEWTGLVSDVAMVRICTMLESRPDEQQLSTHDLAADYARAALGVVRDAMADASMNLCLCCERESHDDSRDDWDGWAHLHAVLLDPDVIEGLPGVVTHEDERLLREVCDLLAEPASSWVSRLLDNLRDAA